MSIFRELEIDVVNRTACQALKEMRALLKTVDDSTLDRFKCTMSYLVEELQSMYERMESALYDKKDIEYYRKELKELKREVEKLKEQKKELEDD